MRIVEQFKQESTSTKLIIIFTFMMLFTFLALAGSVVIKSHNAFKAIDAEKIRIKNLYQNEYKLEGSLNLSIPHGKIIVIKTNINYDTGINSPTTYSGFLVSSDEYKVIVHILGYDFPENKLISRQLAIGKKDIVGISTL